MSVAVHPSLERPLPMEIEAILKIIMDAVLPAISQFVPKSKPSPYAKRWWTLDLTQMRRDYTHFRNRASAARRAGFPRPDLQKQAEVARKTYHKAIRQQKKAHWAEFLAEADNIWKAVKFLDPQKGTTFAKVHALTT